MKRTLTAAVAATLAFASFAGPALARDHDHDHRGPPGHERHDGRGHYDSPGHGYGHARWRRGDRIGHAEWRRYERVDWRRHHLRRPPPGYEWRAVNGDYLLAAVATGMIVSIIASQ